MKTWNVEYNGPVMTLTANEEATDRHGVVFTPVKVVEAKQAKTVELSYSDEFCESYIGDRNGKFKRSILDSETRITPEGRVFLKVPKGKDTTLVLAAFSQSCNDGPFTKRFGYTSKIVMYVYGGK